VTGTTFDGDEFNISELKGKVVLVDFWATWCAPCVAELPHVQELYEQHHKDGFEVVGISLDESDTKLADFLHERQVPWITLFEPDPEKRGFNTPVVNHYGINELPTAILVDREGKVVSVHAFDEGLAELLEKHL
jgi:thiol-disulfide isomerase/thioredoxin